MREKRIYKYIIEKGHEKMREKRIYKYIIEKGHEKITELKIPENSVILSIDNQKNEIVMWVEINIPPFVKELELKKRIFVSYHTGSKFFSYDETNNIADYVGTAKLYNDEYICHIYEIKKLGE